jgi:hypothetical protein
MAAIVVASCRLGYEQLDLPSTGDGGEPTNGGAGSSGARSFGGTSGTAADGGTGAADGGAGTADGGSGGAVEVGGMSTAEAGASAGTATNGGGGSGGGTAGASGGPGVCVPDATCACEVFEGHDYRFCMVLTVRAAGAAACQSANMSLVRVDTPEENAWLLQQFIDHGMFIGGGGPIVLLGGNDLQVAGAWRWEDGTLFWDGAPVGTLYTNWSSPPKNNQGNCVGMTSDGKWNGRSCNSGNATVACESL